jgi:hypothetical protein
LCATRQLLGEARLADPRLTRDEHELTAAGESVFQALIESLHLAFASNEDTHRLDWSVSRRHGNTAQIVTRDRHAPQIVDRQASSRMSASER